MNRPDVDRRIRQAVPRSVYDLAKGVYYQGRTLAGKNPGRGRLLPDFLIIGSTKCGTTSLHGWLTEHPFVAATKKEIHFFNIYYYYRPDWYRTCFPSELERQRFTGEQGRPFLVGEATASYMGHNLTPRRVAKLLPDVKLIVCLRNPVDRAYSQFHYFRRRGQETLESFEDALAIEPDRLRGEAEKQLANPHYHSWPLHWASYLMTSRYAEQLERWFEFFPREQFLFLNFDEELTGASQNALDAVYEHLGLPPHDNGEFPALNAGSYEPLSDETRTRLNEYFAPHNQRCYELTGRDFGWPR
jgi:hypothetical protein